MDGEKSERVLLTGATGFLGRHVHAALLRAGFEVIAALRRPSAQGALSTQWVPLDLEQLARSGIF